MYVLLSSSSPLSRTRRLSSSSPLSRTRRGDAYHSPPSPTSTASSTARPHTRRLLFASRSTISRLLFASCSHRTTPLLLFSSCLPPRTLLLPLCAWAATAALRVDSSGGAASGQRRRRANGRPRLRVDSGSVSTPARHPNGGVSMAASSRWTNVGSGIEQPSQSLYLFA